MKLLVTGGTGNVGRAVVERLVRSGHDVLVLTRRGAAGFPGARAVAGDVTDPAALAAAVRGREAIVHLAAMPGPNARTPHEVFRVNAGGTFAVYAAAAREGIRRVVTASSINAYGMQFGLHPAPVAALPLVEEDPGLTTDAYSFSKRVVEEVAEYAWRRDGISGVCLRLPWVAPAEHSERAPVQRHVAACRESLARLRALPAEERQRTVAGWVEHRNAWRARAPWNDPAATDGYAPPDPLAVAWTDFWARIDERDAAQAVEKGLAASYEGAHVLFVNDDQAITGVPSRELATLFFPGVRFRDGLDGTGTLVSISAARRLIGFVPEYSVGRWFADA